MTPGRLANVSSILSRFSVRCSTRRVEHTKSWPKPYATNPTPRTVSRTLPDACGRFKGEHTDGQGSKLQYQGRLLWRLWFSVLCDHRVVSSAHYSLLTVYQPVCEGCGSFPIIPTWWFAGRYSFVLARPTCGSDSCAQLNGLAFLAVKYGNVFIIALVYAESARMIPLTGWVWNHSGNPICC
jgi:hypothetical protein